MRVASVQVYELTGLGREAARVFFMAPPFLQQVLEFAQVAPDRAHQVEQRVHVRQPGLVTVVRHDVDGRVDVARDEFESGVVVTRS